MHFCTALFLKLKTLIVCGGEGRNTALPGDCHINNFAFETNRVLRIDINLENYVSEPYQKTTRACCVRRFKSWFSSMRVCVGRGGLALAACPCGSNAELLLECWINFIFFWKLLFWKYSILLKAWAGGPTSETFGFLWVFGGQNMSKIINIYELDHHPTT